MRAIDIIIYLHLLGELGGADFLDAHTNYIKGGNAYGSVRKQPVEL